MCALPPTGRCALKAAPGLTIWRPKAALPKPTPPPPAKFKTTRESNLARASPTAPFGRCAFKATPGPNLAPEGRLFPFWLRHRPSWHRRDAWPRSTSSESQRGRSPQGGVILLPHRYSHGLLYKPKHHPRENAYTAFAAPGGESWRAWNLTCCCMWIEGNIGMIIPLSRTTLNPGPSQPIAEVGARPVVPLLPVFALPPRHTWHPPPPSRRPATPCSLFTPPLFLKLLMAFVSKFGE